MPADPARPPGRPHDPLKRDALIAAAQALFVERGYAGTSMAAVAAAAGVSKLTAYRHFHSKSGLFADAVAARCESMFAGLDVAHLAALDARDGLIAFGEGFLALVLTPTTLGVHRLIAAERERSPELGRLFYDNAILFTTRRLAALIAEHVARGTIAPGDPITAAQDLLTLLRGRPTLLDDLGLAESMPLDRAMHVGRCVDLMLRAWTGPAFSGAPASPPPGDRADAAPA